MTEIFWEIFHLDDGLKEDLWNNADIIFDTSAICELYNMTDKAKKTVCKILDTLSERIWIPAHVMYEYLKNRDKVIMNPIQEKYNNPKLPVDDIKRELDKIVKTNDDDNFHPYIEETSLDKIKEQAEIIKSALKTIKDEIKAQYEKRKEEIENIKSNDILKECIENKNIGKPFSFQEILEIIKEGEVRYRNMLPPGYMDDNEVYKKKKGFQKYGDLIIWKEILRYSSIQKRPVILICNDKKEDWFNTDKKSELESPRHELLKEFNDCIGSQIWIFTLVQFIDLLREKCKDETVLNLFDGLEAIKYYLLEAELKKKYKTLLKDSMLLRCKECDHLFEINADDLNFDWEMEEYDERGMGNECHYSSTELCECPNCEKDIELTLNAWEYPPNSFNEQDIESDDAIIVQKMDLCNHILFQEKETCNRCGKWAELDELGLCDNCRAEYEYLLSKDD